METVTPAQAASAGLSRSGLYRAVRAGSLERIARGIYRDASAEAADVDWLEAATRRPESTICLTSALSHYDLTDAIPDALDIAFPRGTRIPSTPSAIRWHSFARDTFDIGRSQIQIPGSDLLIGIYSPERTIADTFRMRGELGYEVGRDALREWLRRGGKPAALVSIATRLPRAKAPLLHALEMLS